jgi:protein-S-isoprenylcysteine O-methyltransferase Ste14
LKDLNVFEIALISNMIIGAIIRFPYEKMNKKFAKKDSNHNFKEKFFLILTFTGGMTLPILYFLTPWFDFANFKVNTLLGAVGILIIIPSNWLFLRSHKDLDSQFSPKLEIKESHKLITHGVYKSIRHPMYASLLSNSCCQLLLIGNWVVAPAYLIGLGCLYLTRVGNEEHLMLKHFGSEYSDYANRTYRLFPKLSSKENA